MVVALRPGWSQVGPVCSVSYELVWQNRMVLENGSMTSMVGYGPGTFNDPAPVFDMRVALLTQMLCQ